MLNSNSSINYLQPSDEASYNIKPSGLSKLKGLARQSKLANQKIVPKIVGDIRHYPPANKEWKNSIYAYNKNSLKSLAGLDKMANKTIKSYFNLTNNKKLARSERMRNLIRRRTVRKLFVSRPEIKQTSDKVNITVYTFNRERQFFLRKMYFYNRNLNINKNIYLYKLWSKKNLLAFKKTFENRKSINLIGGSKRKRNQTVKTQRKDKNRTYIHNKLLREYFLRGLSANAIASKPKQVRKNKKSLFKKVMIALLVKKLQTKKVDLPVNKLKTLPILIANNLFKSLKKRNLIISLKKQERKKITSNLKIYDLLPNNYVKKTFKNYLTNKISRKINFKLRNSNSIVKIKQKLKKPKRFSFKKIRLPYSNLKFKNEIKFFSFKLVSELKYIRKLFQFYFIRYVFYTLGVKIEQAKSKSAKYVLSNYSKTIYIYKTLANKIENKDSMKEIKIILLKNRYSYDKLKNIELLNLELLHFLKTVLSGRDTGSKPALNIVFNKKESIDFLYKKFENKYFLRFLAKFFKKEFLYINYYSKFLINQLKFGKFLPGLKLLISKIYAKKVELNIVNLKYSHLNSDIYTDSIAIKLKRKLGLLRVLEWSLNLVKLPYKYLLNNNSADLNQLQSLNIYNSLDIHTLSEKKNKSYSFEDRLHGVLDKLYPFSLAHDFSSFNKQDLDYKLGENLNNRSLNVYSGLAHSSFPDTEKEKLTKNSNFTISNKSLSVLNIIKYKWVSGVRLEAAGRLTRRYSAARSVFKFKYKGSLKNIDYSQKTNISNKNISTVMLRNYAKSNSQYSFTKSKKRIGAFGLKAWIASY